MSEKVRRKLNSDIRVGRFLWRLVRQFCSYDLVLSAGVAAVLSCDVPRLRSCHVTHGLPSNEGVHDVHFHAVLETETYARRYRRDRISFFDRFISLI